MYSATPPENVTSSIGVRDGKRIEPQQARAAGRRRAAVHRLEQPVRHARGERARGLRRELRARASRSMPSSAAKRRPASSMRTMRPAGSRQTSRAPTSSAVRSVTLPSAQTAIFEVPPPTSTFMTVALSRIERATAPEP